MLPNLPLDTTGRQIREDDTVVFASTEGASLIVAKVFKITPCFVHMVSVVCGKEFIYKRSFRNVYVIRGEK